MANCDSVRQQNSKEVSVHKITVFPKSLMRTKISSWKKYNQNYPFYFFNSLEFECLLPARTSSTWSNIDVSSYTWLGHIIVHGNLNLEKGFKTNSLGFSK